MLKFTALLFWGCATGEKGVQKEKNLYTYSTRLFRERAFLPGGIRLYAQESKNERATYIIISLKIYATSIELYDKEPVLSVAAHRA